MLAVVAAASLLVVPVVDAKKNPRSPVKKDATYRGLTSQGAVCHVDGVDNRPCTVSLKTSKDGKKVVSMLIRYGAACRDESKYFRSSTRFRGLPITEGKFEQSAGYGEPIAGGGHAESTVSMHGAFKRKDGRSTVSGDFHVKSKLTFPDDKPTKCGSGKVTWSARPE
jgi:hypothetical protein